MTTQSFPAKTPLGRRVRVLGALNTLLVRIGAIPSTEKAGHLPMARRLALRSPGWALLPPTGNPRVDDRVVAGRHGDVPVRVYRPEGARPGSTEADPPHHRPATSGTATLTTTALLYVHGGGWTVGGLDSLDWFCRELATRAGCTVVSVEYRLSPDFRFPVPLDDVTDALGWLALHLTEFGAARIAVAGDSAGGNLAAAVCRRARRDGPPVETQILIYPGLDLTLNSPSMFDAPGGLSRADMQISVNNFIGDQDANNPEISPLLAPDKAGLPAALVITADHDLLRDDGRLYAEQLIAAGVPARVVEFAGVDHGFLSLPALTKKQSLAALDLVVDQLKGTA
ncbi:MAG: acetyl esterase [Subtercola sp.]|nr:acetyl esterase [Subtercola sp.]